MAIDKITGIFFLLLSVYVCIESYRLGLGSPSNPKAGLFPFICGCLLAIFSSLGVFNRMSLKQSVNDIRTGLLGWKSQKIACSLVVLFVYTFTLKKLGFFICTFLFVFFIFEIIEPWKLKRGAVFALLSSIASYIVFQELLKSQLPRGFLGF